MKHLSEDWGGRLKLLRTVSRGGGTVGLGEALENRVGPLVKGGELKGLEGADGKAGEQQTREKRMKTQKTVKCSTDFYIKELMLSNELWDLSDI